MGSILGRIALQEEQGKQEHKVVLIKNSSCVKCICRGIPQAR